MKTSWATPTARAWCGLALAGFTTMASPSAQAYSTFTDASAFASLFSDPARTIDFSQLRDGSSFSSALGSNPLVHSTVGGLKAIREYGWASDLLIGSTSDGCGCAWTTTLWDGNTISPTNYPSIYVDTGFNARAVALSTSIGFLAFVPDAGEYGRYLLPAGVSIDSLQYGFTLNSPVSPVPVPSSWLLMLAGLGVLRLRLGGKSNGAAQPQPAL